MPIPKETDEARFMWVRDPVRGTSAVAAWAGPLTVHALSPCLVAEEEGRGGSALACPHNQLTPRSAACPGLPRSRHAACLGLAVSCRAHCLCMTRHVGEGGACHSCSCAVDCGGCARPAACLPMAPLRRRADSTVQLSLCSRRAACSLRLRPSSTTGSPMQRAKPFIWGRRSPVPAPLCGCSWRTTAAVRSLLHFALRWWASDQAWLLTRQAA